MNKKAVLIILDGWGIGNGDNSDATAKASVPYFRKLWNEQPRATLRTSGEDVGLPAGQMGNSEVGHLNIGAGRVVYQDLVRINKAIREKTIDSDPVLLEAFRYAKTNGKKLHLMGLVSDGGVHSSQEHLHHLVSMAKNNGVDRVYVHAFTDGRDTDPKSGLKFITDLSKHCSAAGAGIATITGRYYAMDRDKRWERVKLAYDALLHGTGKKENDAVEAMQHCYDAGETDEFIKPVILDANGMIEENDAVICFNFRTDRCREITTVLTQKDMPEQGMKTIPLHYVTMTNYDDTYRNVHVVFSKDNLEMTLGEVISRSGKTQIRIAETEKYPHVTFFFSGGREKEFDGERRLLVASPKVATYDLQPEMSAGEVTNIIVPELEKSSADFVCLNFANPDMVGHTGVFSAVTKALETVDRCLERVVEAGKKSGYSFIIIADHGNADYMINADGSPNTAHTTNPVPLILIDSEYSSIRDGRLADIAPTLLRLLHIEAPKEMTGVALVG